MKYLFFLFLKIYFLIKKELKKIIIPDSFIYIHYSSFKECNSLTDNKSLFRLKTKICKNIRNKLIRYKNEWLLLIMIILNILIFLIKAKIYDCLINFNFQIYKKKFKFIKILIKVLKRI